MCLQIYKLSIYIYMKNVIESFFKRMLFMMYKYKDLRRMIEIKNKLNEILYFDLFCCFNFIIK